MPRKTRICALALLMPVLSVPAIREAHADLYVNFSELTYNWEPANGNTDFFEIYVSVDDEPWSSAPTAIVRSSMLDPEGIQSYSFSGQDQRSYQVRVRAVSNAMGPGPFSDPSETVVVLLTGSGGDMDGDGLPNDLEDAGCSSPYDSDTDNDGVPDGEEDSNGNGQVDPGETDPCFVDLVTSIICDNGTSCTSSTGTWRISRASYPYGDDSYYAKHDATYTWSFQVPRAGLYNVDMCWTESASRCTSCPVTLNCNSEVLDRYTLNQRENGGQWNNLGSFYAGTEDNCAVTITAAGSAGTCADAVKLTPVDGGGE